MIKLLMIFSLILAICTLVLSTVRLFKDNDRNYIVTVVAYPIIILVLIFCIVN